MADGFLEVKNADDIVSELEPKQEVASFRSMLSLHIDQCFQESSNWKSSNITPRIEDCLRRKQGKYPPELLALLTKMGGCKLYFNKTAEKCSALEAGLEDVLLNASGRENRPWRLSPTPIPDLPEEIEESIKKQIVSDYAKRVEVIEAEASITGIDSLESMRMLMDEFITVTMDMYDEELKRLWNEAQKRVERMEDLVADQLVEGGFYNALHGLIQQISTFPFGCIKGPTLEWKKRLSWEKGKLAAKNKIVPTFHYVPLMNLFWIPDAQDIHDGYIIERRSYSVTTLLQNIGKEGWIDNEIREAISEWKRSKRTSDISVTGDSQMAAYQNRDPNSSNSTTSMWCLEFWGLISGEDLLNWADENQVILTEHGFESVKEDDWYYVCATTFNGHILNLRKHWNLLDESPYHVTSYEKVLESVCGMSPPEKMAAAQDAYNNQLRAAINNGIMSSGPTIVWDADQCDATTIGEHIQPYAQVSFNGNRANSPRAPFFFYQTENIQRAMLDMTRFFSDMAGDDSGIQPITYANGNSGPASSTAYGVGVLQNAAERILKRVFGYIDREIIAPCLNMLIQYNNLFEKNPSLKGDAVAVPCGSLLAMQRDSIQMRRIEFAAATNNPVDYAIMGERGRANLIRQIAVELYMPADKLVPPDSFFADRARKAIEYQAEQAIPEPPPDTGDAPQQGENLVQPGQINDPNSRVDINGQDIQHGATYHA